MTFVSLNKDCKTISELGLNDRFNQLFSYWQSTIQDGEIFPSKARFDPVDIPKLLSMLVTVDVKYEDHLAEDEFRIFLRLIGTEMVEHWGIDHSGQFLDEVLENDILSYVYDQYRTVVEEKRPFYSHYVLRWNDGRISNASRLYLPYYSGEDSSKVTHVVVGHILSHEKKRVQKKLIDGVSGINIVELDRKVL